MHEKNIRDNGVETSRKKLPFSQALTETPQSDTISSKSIGSLAGKSHASPIMNQIPPFIAPRKESPPSDLDKVLESIEAYFNFEPAQTISGSVDGEAVDFGHFNSTSLPTQTGIQKYSLSEILSEKLTESYYPGLCVRIIRKKMLDVASETPFNK